MKIPVWIEPVAGNGYRARGGEPLLVVGEGATPAEALEQLKHGLQRRLDAGARLVELDVPAMVHVSASANPNFHGTGAHYINGDTTAFMQFITSDLFKDFPTLRMIIPHGGGAAPYHWGRYRGLAQDMKKPPLEELLLKNVFFDTCVYHKPGIELLFKVVPIDNILFASEMVGAVRGVDPFTGHYYDDTKFYIDALPLSDDDRRKVFEGNARRVYRLDRTELYKRRG